MTSLTPQHIQAILAKAEEVKKDPTRFKDYADYPVEFARDILGIKRLKHQPAEFFPNDCGLWTKQQDILRAAVVSDRVAIRSGHGVSKSHTCAVLIIWWHLARQGRVVSTGPTREHLEDVLWPELHHVVGQSLVSLPGQLDRLNWKQDNYWYATGLTTDKSSAFQGRHHPWLLALMDEAAGVEEPIHLEIGNCATGEKNLVLMVGNPTITSGSFYEAFKHPDVWTCLHISCLEHPNVLTGRELIPGGVSKKWVESRRREWGEQHPFWFSRVLGQFPIMSEKGVIPLLWMERAQNAEKRAEELKRAEKARLPRVASLDVARYGQNKCVLIIRRGDAVEYIESWGHTSTMETLGKVIHLQREWHFRDFVIDASGMGAPVADRLFEQTLPFQVHAHIGGARAGRDRIYSNRRSEMWWHLRLRMEKQRLWMVPGNTNPDIEHLCADLVRPEYAITSAGRIQVETKEALMDRGVKSPDWADALSMSFAIMEEPDAELEEPIGEYQDPQAYRELRAPEIVPFEQLPIGYGTGQDPEAGPPGQF